MKPHYFYLSALGGWHVKVGSGYWSYMMGVVSLRPLEQPRVEGLPK